MTKERREYIINGVSYIVDGKYVVLTPTKQEEHIAKILAEKYGKQVEFVPRIMYPQGIQTPDYMIDGERFDLKTLSGQGKNLLYGAIAKKRRQSHNFIIDSTCCPLRLEELERQIESLFKSQRTGFLEQLVLMKNDEIVKVYARNKKNRP
ncbi:MAG: hypothetical protein IJ521_02000 [Schwartzia sp.]|nr:hypothetical protein [Schwartzia sp. (in: firmicutes)]